MFWITWFLDFGNWIYIHSNLRSREVPTHLHLIEGASLSFLFVLVEKKCPCDNCVNK